VPTPSGGRTFYLSPTGSDTASGSLSAPRRTLLAGSRLLAPGDTLLVRGGTYRDPGGYNWATTADGTASAPITVKNVSYITFDGLAFTRYHPRDNGIILVLEAEWITFRRVRSYAHDTVADTEHHIYVSGAANVLVDQAYLTGIRGAAVHIYGRPSSNVRVTNSAMIDNGVGILASNQLQGGTFTGNVLEGNGKAFWFVASGASRVKVSRNRIQGPVGIWIESLSAAPIEESLDCIDSEVPFRVGWPGSPRSLAWWQSSGRGEGTTLSGCP
jgi:hypothetical protein